MAQPNIAQLPGSDTYMPEERLDDISTEEPVGQSHDIHLDGAREGFLRICQKWRERRAADSRFNLSSFKIEPAIWASMDPNNTNLLPSEQLKLENLDAFLRAIKRSVYRLASVNEQLLTSLIGPILGSSSAEFEAMQGYAKRLRHGVPLRWQSLIQTHSKNEQAMRLFRVGKWWLIHTILVYIYERANRTLFESFERRMEDDSSWSPLQIRTTLLRIVEEFRGICKVKYSLFNLDLLRIHQDVTPMD